MSVAMEARKNQNGWTGKNADDKAKSPHAGYVLGCLFLDGRISREQLDAGDEFALAIARYYRLTGIPFPSARAQSLFSIKGHDGEVTAEHASRARLSSNLMMALRGVLLQTVDGPQVSSTVWNVAVMDVEHLRGMHDQQCLWLRRGLDALKKSGLLPNANRLEMAS